MLLTHAFTRSFCQVFTKINQRSYPTVSPFFRTSATAPPRCGDADGDVECDIFVLEITILCYRHSVSIGPVTAAASLGKIEKITITMNVVTATQLKSMLTNKNVQLFDVRGPEEYQAGHIPSAVNMPLNDLEVSLKLPSETFEQKFQVKPPAKEDDNIVFNCRSGVRSARALDIARRLGFAKARHLQGGFIEWEEEEAKGKSTSS